MATITTTTLQSTGGLEAAVLSDLVVQGLYDSSDLTSVMTRIPWSASGGAALSVTIDANPGAFAAPGEGSDCGAVAAYTTGEFVLTPARYCRRYAMTDLVGLTGSPITLERVAANLIAGVSLTMTDFLCSLFPSVSSAVGNSTTALSVDGLYSAAFDLNNDANMGPYTVVLYPGQMNDFRSSLRAESGAVAFRESTFETIRPGNKGPGYNGEWGGISFFQSDSVGTDSGASGARCGAMFSQGAFAYTMADPRLAQGAVSPDNVIFANELMLLERNRDAVAAITQIIGNIYPAIVEAEDNRAVRVHSS